MHTVLADRGGELIADCLDDGVRANWLRLCREVLALAATDLIAATYPDCAESYISGWLGDDGPARCLKIERARGELIEYWRGEGREWAEWLGCPDDVTHLLKATCPHLPGESPQQIRKRIAAVRERVRVAFATYGGKVL